MLFDHRVIHEGIHFLYIDITSFVYIARCSICIHKIELSTQSQTQRVTANEKIADKKQTESHFFRFTLNVHRCLFFVWFDMVYRIVYLRIYAISQCKSTQFHIEFQCIHGYVFLKKVLCSNDGQISDKPVIFLFVYFATRNCYYKLQLNQFLFCF